MSEARVQAGKLIAKRLGSNHMSEIAKKSVEARIKKYGPDYYNLIRQGKKPSEILQTQE